MNSHGTIHQIFCTQVLSEIELKLALAKLGFILEYLNCWLYLSEDQIFPFLLGIYQVGFEFQIQMFNSGTTKVLLVVFSEKRHHP